MKFTVNIRKRGRNADKILKVNVTNFFKIKRRYRIETTRQGMAKVKGAKTEIQKVRANKQILTEYIYRLQVCPKSEWKTRIRPKNKKNHKYKIFLWITKFQNV